VVLIPQYCFHAFNAARMLVYKYYTSNFVPLENWKDLLEILDEAIDFSQQSLS
jgi:hypothetical protein